MATCITRAAARGSHSRACAPSTSSWARSRRAPRPRSRARSWSNSDWHEAQLKEKRLPHRRELDRVGPKNPVVLVRGGHEFILNSAALLHWNISKSIAIPPGGEIGHDADVELNAELVDTARGLVTLPPPAKVRAEGIASQMRLLSSVRRTSVRSPG